MSKLPCILIVEGRFYSEISDSLANGMIKEIEKANFTYERISVPGVFEIPTTIAMAIKSSACLASPRYVGYIASGCVIRGETDHYEHICREASRAIMSISIKYCVAIGFGILTCENWDQAMERANPEGKNKGGEAARACLRLTDCRKYFKL